MQNLTSNQQNKTSRTLLKDDWREILQKYSKLIVYFLHKSRDTHIYASSTCSLNILRDFNLHLLIKLNLQPALLVI